MKNNIKNVKLTTLFEQFILHYNFKENRNITLKEKYDKKEHFMHSEDFYFNIQDPIDLVHNPGDRS